MSENYKEYLQSYFPIKSYGDKLNYKIRDLKKVTDYNKIITTKDNDEIEFIEEKDESFKNEDNLRFGDYTDITAPYPLSKFSSNNNFLINDNENGEAKRKRSLILKYKGEKDKESLNENQQTGNILSFLINRNNNQGKILENSIHSESNKSYKNDNKILVINKNENTNITKKEKNNNNNLKINNTIKSNHTKLSKENELKSIKEGIEKYKSLKKRNSLCSSSLNSSFSIKQQNDKLSENKIDNEVKHIKFSQYDNEKESYRDKNSELHNSFEDGFNFGKLLINYTNNIKLKRMNIQKREKDINNRINIKEITIKPKFSFNDNGPNSIEENVHYFVENNDKLEENNICHNNYIKGVNNANTINRTNSNNNSKCNSKKSNYTEKEEIIISNIKANNDKISITYNSKNSSFKDIIIRDSKSNKNEIKKIEPSDRNEIKSIKSEEEPSIRNINCSKTQLCTNNNYFPKTKNFKQKYNPFLISFFSKNNKKQSNQLSNFPLTDRTNSTSEKNDYYLKANKNLNLWLLLNKKKEKKSVNKINNNSLNKTSSNESSSRDIIDFLNDSYSYIKNFFFDNYRDNKKRCLLRKKVLVELNPRKSINSKIFKNNSHLEMIQKLKNKSVSLDQEKEYLGYFKDILNHHSQNRYSDYNNKINNTSRSKSSNSYENSTSNKTYRGKFYYPNVFYVNENYNLHKKTHVSYLFSKLKANNKLK